MKNIINEINSQTHQKVSEFEDIGTELVQNEGYIEKSLKKSK